MARIGQELEAPETGWKRYDDRDANITYVGDNWNTGSGYGYNSTYKQSLSKKNVAVKFNFIGTKLRIIGAHYTDKTELATIFIDGVSFTTINQKGELVYQSLECDISGLANQEHSVSIVNNTAGYLWIDAIDVDETGELKPYTPIVTSTNLVATAGDLQVNLAWAAVDGATGYNVKRSTIAGGPYTTLASNRSGTSYQDNSVTNDTTYYYVVTAITTAGESPNSNEAFATPVAKIVASPKNLTAAGGDSQVTLSWSAVDGATSYNVKRATTAGGPYTTLPSNGSGTSYLDASVTNGTIYYYVVTAVNTGGESKTSNEVSATPSKSTPTPEPTANALLRITIIDSSEYDYQLSTTAIDSFVNWFNNHTSTNTASYMFDKKVGTQNSKEYLAFDKIISFEVIDLK